ncbi:hypothetical protein D3C78_1573710 [compost metagenome]
MKQFTFTHHTKETQILVYKRVNDETSTHELIVAWNDESINEDFEVSVDASLDAEGERTINELFESLRCVKYAIDFIKVHQEDMMPKEEKCECKRKGENTWFCPNAQEVHNDNFVCTL